METPGYWTCTSCQARNLRQLRFCVGCDTPHQGASSPYVSPNNNRSGGQVSPLDRARSYFSPRLGSPSTSSYTPAAPRSSSGRHGPATLSVDPLTPPVASPAIYGTTPLRVERSPASPIVANASAVSHADASFLGSELRAREAENHELKCQLEDAVRAHRDLLKEYKSTNSHSQCKDSDIEILSNEVMTLRVRLDKEETLRRELCERQATELQSRERIVATQRDQIESLSAERDRLLDKMQQITLGASRSRMDESVEVAQSLAAKEREIVGLNEHAKGLQNRHTDSLATVAKLTRELEDYRTQDARIRNNHAEDLQRVLKDTLTANESTIAKVTQELMNSKAESEKQWEKERAMMMAQYNKAVADGVEVRNQEEKQLRREMEHSQALQVSYDKLVVLKDELQSEAKFQLEIISDLKADKAGLQAEVNTLRVAISTMPAPGFEPRRDSSMSLVRPSLVNQGMPLGTSTTVAASSETRGGADSTSPPPDDGAGSQISAPPAENSGNIINQQVRINELEAKVQGLEFENAEFKKQLQRAQKALADRDSDLEEANENLDEAERSLIHEKAYSEETEKENKKLEAKVKDQAKTLNAQIEDLTKQNKDLSEQNIALREKTDATDLSLEEMEESLADALAAVAMVKPAAVASQRADTTSLGSPLADRTVTLKPAQPTPAPAKPAPIGREEEEELDASEKKDLEEGFKEGSKAMKGLAALQKRMKKK